MDERITLNHRDYIPYGTDVVKKLLRPVFPGAMIYFDMRSPGNWDSLAYDDNNQAAIIMAKDFYPDDEQLQRLLLFARQGNYVFIIAKSFSPATEKLFNFSVNTNILDNYQEFAKDSLWLTLDSSSFAGRRSFVYPGRRYESFFDSIDTVHSIILGHNGDGNPDFIQYKAGNGYIFIHTAPLAFSNYFILHRNNAQYFQKVMSVIPEAVNKIAWNEYYLNRRNYSDKEPSFLKILFRFPAFKWGMLTAMLLLLLFALVNMRRRQKMIPPYKKPLNDSLDFVKTLGRLYYDRHDHKNLANKMTVYFLDRVRTRYKMNTQHLNQGFTEILSYKSGYPLAELTTLITLTNEINLATVISEKELAAYYNQLELFYQNT